MEQIVIKAIQHYEMAGERQQLVQDTLCVKKLTDSRLKSWMRKLKNKDEEFNRTLLALIAVGSKVKIGDLEFRANKPITFFRHEMHMEGTYRSRRFTLSEVYNTPINFWSNYTITSLHHIEITSSVRKKMLERAEGVVTKMPARQAKKQLEVVKLALNELVETAYLGKRFGVVFENQTIDIQCNFLRFDDEGPELCNLKFQFGPELVDAHIKKIARKSYFIFVASRTPPTSLGLHFSTTIHV